MPAALRTTARSTPAARFLHSPERRAEAVADRGLVREQGALAVQATPVAREAAVGADDAVARDHDRDGVPAVGEPDRAHAAGVAEVAGDRAVGGRLPVRDLEQLR